ncbi:MAG: 50S ribosomal protein L33 [Chlamydiae bacterium]|nr:50S ribosomal protein L33 [Chlamydiota bacterium]
MAKKRENITLKSSKSNHTYHTVKNKTNSPDRIELKKYDPNVREHVPYKESKK